MKKDIMQNVSRTFHKFGFKVKKHSPEILIVAGTVGVVTSAVVACKATLKVKDVLDEAKSNINDIHDCVADVEAGVIPANKYTVEDSKKDLTIVYVQTGVKLAKLYAPAVTLGVLSLTAIIKSNDILRKRNVALAAAYTVVDKSFKEYRSRVVKRFGKELDRELRYNIKATEVEEKVINAEGNEETVKKTVNIIDPNAHSDYSKFFYEGNLGWDKDPDQRLCFLKCQQATANNMLRERGHLFLNEVYDLLGINRTREGAVVGWIYDEKNPIGDNFVDFGFCDPNNPQVMEFYNGTNQGIMLDFNVDGYILDLLA